MLEFTKRLLVAVLTKSSRSREPKAPPAKKEEEYLRRIQQEPYPTPKRKSSPSPHDKYAFKTGPHLYTIDEFVTCRYEDSNGFPAEDFGHVVEVLPPDGYKVRLQISKEVVYVLSGYIKKAGQA